jgi:hypothetical protein
VSEFLTIDIKTFAGCSCSRGTSWGSTLARAGRLMAATTPLTAVSAISCHSCAVPVITRAAIASWLTPATTLETWMTSVRPKRSAITPPASRNTIIGMLWAASTVPSALGEWLTSRTAKARATELIAPPTRLTARERKYQRKFCSRSGAKDPDQLTGGP